VAVSVSQKGSSGTGGRSSLRWRRTFSGSFSYEFSIPGSIVCLVLTLGLLAWGLLWQEHRPDPFQTPGLLTRYLTPEPHPAFGAMPYEAVPGQEFFRRRGLCKHPDQCGGLVVPEDGLPYFTDSDGRVRIARKLERSQSGRLVALTPSGKLFALGEGEQKKQTWNAISLPLEAVYDMSLGTARDPDKAAPTARSVGYAPDGRHVIVGFGDGSATIYSDVGVAERQLVAGKAAIGSVTISSDGMRAATASEDGTVRLWGLSARDHDIELVGHHKPVTSVSFSYDGLHVVTASSDDTVRKWDARTGKELLNIPVQGEANPSAAFSPNDELIITAGESEVVRVFGAGDGVLRREYQQRGHRISPAAFSPNGEMILTWTRDGRVSFWNVRSGKVNFNETVSANPVLVSTNHDGSMIVAFYASGVNSVLRPSNLVRDPAYGHLNDDDLPIIGAPYEQNDSLRARFRRDGKIGFSRELWRIFEGMRTVPPLIDDFAFSQEGDDIWAVGRRGYIATGKVGQELKRRDIPSNIDLTSVSVIEPTVAIMLGLTRSSLEDAQPTAPTKDAPELTKSGPELTKGDPAQQYSPQQQSAQQSSPMPAPPQQRPRAGQVANQMAEIVLVRELASPRMDKKIIRTELPPSVPNRIPMTFVGASTGWIAGPGGDIAYTSDGGDTWTKVHRSPGIMLTDLRIEPGTSGGRAGVGWALGHHENGRTTVVAASQANALQGPDGWNELPHYIARWWFLLGIPCLFLSGYHAIRARKGNRPPPKESIEEVGVSDEPLRWDSPDARVLKPLAGSLSRFLRNVNTKPPLTISITGGWGSGKSSLMMLLMEDLRRFGGRAVWFNAWHHREEDHLLAALFETIRRDGPPEWWSWPGLYFRLRLLWGRTKGAFVNLFYLAVFLGIAFLTVYLIIPPFTAMSHGPTVEGIISMFGGEQVDETWRAIWTLVGGGGIASLLALWLKGKLIALPAKPAMLAAALARRASLGDFSEKLAFRHRFGTQFREFCEALLTRTSPGLILLIDDLDRCKPEDVLKILEAVNYLATAGPCTIIIGMDRRQVEHSVGLGFEKLVAGLPEEELIYRNEEKQDEAGKQRAFARHYLEKLINIEVPVPPLDDASTEAMLVREAAPCVDIDVPKWLAETKRYLWKGFQVARVGLLAYLVGVLLAGAIDRMEAINPSDLAGRTTTVSGPAAPSPPQTAPGGIAPSISSEPITVFTPAKVNLEGGADLRQVPPSGQWMWWTPTIFGVGVAVLFGFVYAIHNESQVVRDSPEFTRALRAVRPLITARRPTPRVIKRYQNRMRYLAARLRPSVHQPDSMDSLLNRIGRMVGREIVPEEWFNEVPPQGMPESALILLGAIEIFAPKTFTNPAKLFAGLNGTAGDGSTDEHAKEWELIRNSYRDNDLKLPTAFEIERYATFVLSHGRPTTAHPGEILNFPRDPSSEAKPA
jgi:hypothetical protein